jgi:Tfp pilus assembly protein PilF
MAQTRCSLVMGLVVLTSGCTLPVAPVASVDSRNTQMAPIQRMQHSAGTAAGQYAVGRIDLAEGRYEAAVVRFGQAIQLDPQMIDAYNALGVAHGLAGNYGKAASAFEAALVVAPNAPHVLNNLGFAQLKTGNLDDAWTSFKRAFEIEPRNVKTRENIRLLALARRDAAQPEHAPQAATTALPAATSSVAAVAVPAARPSYEVVMPASNDGNLVRISPGLYEIRSGVHASAAQQPPPARANVTPAAIAPAVAKPAPTAPAPDAPAPPAPATTAPADSAPIASNAATEPARPTSSVSVAASPLPASPVAGTVPAAAPALPTVPLSVSMAALGGLEISNGVGTRHLAGRTARSLSQLGIGVARVSNYEVFGKSRTEIHYRNGHQASARALQAALPVDAKLQAGSRLRQSVNIRLVIGRDMVGRDLALSLDAIQAADNTASTPTHTSTSPGIDLNRLARAVVRIDFDDGWRHL